MVSDADAPGGTIHRRRSSDMLIHATVTISGDAALRIACEARLRRLLSHQFLKNEVTEHHGPEALCYDLKVEGGIPFPVFAQASREFPGLTFEADWVNVAQGEKGGATIVDGRATSRGTARVPVRTADEHPVYVEVTPDGRLRLALTLLRAARDEWRGYAVTATRDALIRAVRRSGTGHAELDATQGAAEWALAWRRASEAAGPVKLRDAAPRPIEKVLFGELEALARRFAGEWIWLSDGPREEIAVEADRYARYGYPVNPANVRSVHVHRLRAEAAEGAPMVHSTLAVDDEWVKDLVLQTWGRDE